MVSIVERTSIHAPIERCFYLSLNIDLHQQSTAQTQERAVAGVTTGSSVMESELPGVAGILVSCCITRAKLPYMRLLRFLRMSWCQVCFAAFGTGTVFLL